MATESERRRQIILLVILGVLVAAFLGRMLLSGGGDDKTAPTSTPSATTLVPGATTTSAATTTTEPQGTVPPDTFDIYSTRNPFEPAFQETPTTVFGSTTTVFGATTTTVFGATTTTVYGATTTTGAGGTTTTGAGGTTTSTQPSYNPPQGTAVALLDVYTVGTTPMASMTVGSTGYTVGVGDLFGPGSSYRVVSLDEPCGQFLYGDVPFRLCEGEQVIK